ncbi:MAG: tRNA (adenosine(37)-N6)-dimethylallyltransferase MiaA [Verrucomicrobiota bacterium]
MNEVGECPIYIAGPTGCGKSAVAVRLAEKIGGEIVNADAFQIYGELRIITARPSREDEERVPHHLYGAFSCMESCDASRYAEHAEPIVAEIAARGQTPIIVGGSGLYIKALTHGLQDAPPADPEIRAELNALSLQQLQDRLRELDPASADRIDPQNRRYVQRATEICLITGRPASEAREAWENDDPTLRGIVLTRPREELYERINQRVDLMIDEGAIEEVAAVETWSETAIKAIGVREIQQLLNGEIDKAECVAQIQQASRRFAKRQLTWFNREKWLTPMSADETIENLPFQ